MKKKTYENIKIDLENHGLFLLTTKDEYKNTCTELVISNGIYKIIETYKTYSAKHAEPTWFSKNNPFIIENINIYLKNNKKDYLTCISPVSDYKDRESILKFFCKKCETVIESTWNCEVKAINAKYIGRRGIICENCDGKIESLHASILKQLYMHYYPDTILEDKSCINPNTNAILPTDIVNHRMKIAIEVQGQFHKLTSQKIKDKIKKEYWINLGYQFYDYSIDKISVLDYCKKFFPFLKNIPEWVNYEYSNKLNIKKIQEYLNEGYGVVEISNIMNVSAHRIYDAIYDKKLQYPDTYINKSFSPVIQLSINGEFIKEYLTMSKAEKENNIHKGLIASCINNKHYFSSGYFWFYKEDYYSGNYEIPKNSIAKFYNPVDCYDMNNNYVKHFKNMYEAAQENNTIASKIYEVIIGNRKSTKGYKYKLSL